jgi:hypothetical protein
MHSHFRIPEPKNVESELSKYGIRLLFLTFIHNVLPEFELLTVHLLLLPMPLPLLLMPPPPPFGLSTFLTDHMRLLRAPRNSPRFFFISFEAESSFLFRSAPPMTTLFISILAGHRLTGFGNAF